MERYFLLDPDQGSWFLYISNLTETQQAYIRQIFDFLDEEDKEEEGRKFKFFADVPGDYYGDEFRKIINYLLAEGFESVTDCKN